MVPHRTLQNCRARRGCREPDLSSPVYMRCTVRWRMWCEHESSRLPRVSPIMSAEIRDIVQQTGGSDSELEVGLAAEKFGLACQFQEQNYEPITKYCSPSDSSTDNPTCPDFRSVLAPNVGAQASLRVARQPLGGVVQRVIVLVVLHAIHSTIRKWN